MARALQGRLARHRAGAARAPDRAARARPPRDRAGRAHRRPADDGLRDRDRPRGRRAPAQPLSARSEPGERPPLFVRSPRFGFSSGSLGRFAWPHFDQRVGRWVEGEGGPSDRLLPQPGRFIDLFANAVAPLWPSALQVLDRPVIDPDVLEMDDEPIVARELDTDAQRSQLRDHFLRLAATLREDLVPPLLPGHGPRLAPTRAARSPKEAAETAPPDRVHPYSRWVAQGSRAPTGLVSSQGNIRTSGDMPASGRIPTPSSPVKASIPIRRTQLLHFGMLAC